jgi:hypothetical protein
MPIATNKKIYQVFPLASTLLSPFLIMYWKLRGHENMIVLLGLKHVKQAFEWPKWRTVFSVELASALTYIRTAAIVNLRIVAPPIEVEDNRGLIVIKRDSLMHREWWVDLKNILRIEKSWSPRTLCVRSLRQGNVDWL